MMMMLITEYDIISSYQMNEAVGRPVAVTFVNIHNLLDLNRIVSLTQRYTGDKVRDMEFSSS